MGEKLIAFLTPVSNIFQKGVGSISSVLGDIAPFWIVLGVVVVVLIIAIFTLDKPKSLSMLLILYIIGFILLLIPSVMKWLTRSLSAHDFYYAKIALGSLPIVALIVLKYKRRR